MDKRVKKYIGTVIGDFLIMDYSSETHKYQCKCQYCGEEKFLLKYCFNYEKSIHCKCTRSGVKAGDKYYRLTAIQRDMSRLNKGRVYWIWKCDCGNFVSLPLKAIKSGNTKSCGCLNREKSLEQVAKWQSSLEDLTGQKFFKLTVIGLASPEEIQNRPKGVRYWKCQCECGNYHIAGTSDLKLGKVKSCGCLLSQGEMLIEKILIKNNIHFQKQYSFSDLRGKNNRPYKFDFAIFKEKELSYLIEYDGIQHYNKNTQFGNEPEESFQKIMFRDTKKNEYCIKNNIPLIRIPFTKLSTLSLEDLLLENNPFLVKE